MADVNKLVPHIVKWEGGWSDHKNDLGGKTNKGITYQTYKFYYRRKGLPEPSVEQLKNISHTEFTDILKTLYWDVCKADYIVNQSVANAIVDWGWNSGNVTAIKEVQKILGVKADGIVGNITLSAINSRSPLPLFGAIKQARLDYIDEICEARKENLDFKDGWLNRIESLTFKE